MVRVIASVVVVPVLIVCRKVSLLIPDAVLESVAEKVILPVSPPGQVYLRSATPFGRGRTLAASTHRVDSSRLRLQNLLHAEVVLPIVLKVILVQKPLVVYLQLADNSIARKTGSIPPFNRHGKGMKWYATRFSPSSYSSRCSGWECTFGDGNEATRRSPCLLIGPREHHKSPSPLPA